MPLGTNSLTILIKAKDRFSKVFAGANAQMGGMSKGLRGLGISGGLAAAGVGALVVGIGIKAVKAAATFEKSMANVATLVDTSTESMEAMGKEVIELSKEMPVSVGDLTSALYDVRSAGISAEGAMSTLRSSAMLAVAGLGTTKEAANLLTTAINAFGLQGRNSTEVADILFKTVKAGKTTVAELSRAFGKMAGNAKAAGISFEDVQAATAALTALTGQTSQAQNALAQVFLELTVRGGKLDKALQKNHSSLSELNEVIGEKGFVGGMKTLQEQLGITETEFKNMFGSAEGGTAVFQLLTDAYDKNNESRDEMLSGTIKITEAFDEQLESTTLQYQLLKNRLGAVMIDFGKRILPYLVDGMLLLTKTMDWVSSTATKVSFGWQKMILTMERHRMTVKGTEKDVKAYDYALKVLNEDMINFEQEQKKLTEKAEIFREGIKEGAGDFDTLGEAMGGAAETGEKAMSDLEGSVKSLKDTITGLRESVVSNLRKIQDRFWGLSDEEISALRTAADYNKEKMDIIQKEWTRHGLTVEEAGKSGSKQIRQQAKDYLEYSWQVAQANKRIEQLRMARPITPVSEIRTWAEATRGFIEGKIAATGITPPTLAYPRLAPATMTPGQAVNTFNFHFENAFIGDKEAFTREVIGIINRESELQSLGGK